MIIEFETVKNLELKENLGIVMLNEMVFAEWNSAEMLVPVFAVEMSVVANLIELGLVTENAEILENLSDV